MIKPISLLCFILLQCFVIRAQKKIYDFIQLGGFQVGFKDTVVFDTKLQYEAFDYVGTKPYFIQVWYPLVDKPKNTNFLTFKDFFETTKKDKLFNVQVQLKRHYQESVIRDCIKENLVLGDANDYGNYTYEDILDLIGETETKSFICNEIKPSQFPIIVYHHGSQSNSFENYGMAEYFASRGFVFVSANFHLPYENTLFGLKPFDKIVIGEEEQSLRTVIEFAKTLSSSSSVFFMGHSFGAQIGLRTFDYDTTIKGFISLETSIEFKTDKEKIKEIWPEVFQKVSDENINYPFPMLFCAATGEEKPFVFFENLNAPQITFAPTKAEFEHNAYLSMFYLRLFLDRTIKQTDKEILQDRLFLYVKHLELIEEFIDGILKGKSKPKNEIRFVKT